MLLPLLFVVPAVILAIRLQQAEDDEFEATRDDRWWAGMVYSDSSDSRMMVPNRMGAGYTFNLGHPVARIVAPLLILLVLGAALAIPALS